MTNSCTIQMEITSISQFNNSIQSTGSSQKNRSSLHLIKTLSLVGLIKHKETYTTLLIKTDMAIIKLLHKSHKSFINFQFDKKFGTMRYFPGCCSLLWEVCTARNMFLLNIGVILMRAQFSNSSCLVGVHMLQLSFLCLLSSKL